MCGSKKLFPISPKPKPHGDPLRRETETVRPERVPLDVQRAQGPGRYMARNVTARDIVNAKRDKARGKRHGPSRLSITFATNGRGSMTVADRLQAVLGDVPPAVDGTVVQSTGFGLWGVERGVTVVTVTPHVTKVRNAILALLSRYSQEAAYVEHTPPHGVTRYEEWNVDGSIHNIRGN